MQTDPPTSEPSVNLRASMHVFLCQPDSTASVSLSVLTRPPWKQALIIPYDLSLPRLGRASWNAAAAVCALRWAGRLEKTGEVWQGKAWAGEG